LRQKSLTTRTISVDFVLLTCDSTGMLQTLAGPSTHEYHLGTIMAQKSKIIAHLPATIELSRRTTQNSISFQVWRSGSKAGKLVIAQGSVEWWPDYHKVHAHRLSWGKFIALLEGEMPERRSKR